MAYITREDGEHFVIPSYRDVLDARRKSTFKTEVLTLSQSYGEYITLQKKSATQYEVAFSPDIGYLLGESIWHQFKKPLDMIYCEAIPNTTEALMVIVKNGSVYLDGSFPTDSIPEELVIFLTQENNFEIYTYGDVPISKEPEDGKFSFEPTSVKSFTVLDNPVFPSLPLLKIYQLQLVDKVLKSAGIGVFPAKQLVMVAIIAVLGWMMWSFMTAEKEVITVAAPKTSPYQAFLAALTSPAPDQEMQTVLDDIGLLLVLPGWTAEKIEYSRGVLIASVISRGSKIENLMDWAKANNVDVDIRTDGIFLTLSSNLPSRPLPRNIYPLQDVIANFVDRLADVYPGNHITLGDFSSKGVYTDVAITINVSDVTPTVLSLIGALFKDMPFVLQNMSVTVKNGLISGSINIVAMGS